MKNLITLFIMLFLYSCAGYKEDNPLIVPEFAREELLSGKK